MGLGGLMVGRRVHDLADIEHGTPRGASMERRRGLVTCKRCLAAENARKTGWTAARNAALEELRHMFPEQYARLLAKHQRIRGLGGDMDGKTEALSAAETTRRRAAAWHAAAKRLIAEHRSKFDRMYDEEKQARGI